MEQWVNIKDYEGLYKVSDEGRIKSLNYGKERILKPAVNTNGYLCVNLCKDGKVKMHKVHRLVANAFIDNPVNLPQVNHKDECKTNNTVDNLEWCTSKYNTNYGTRNERVAEAHRGVPRPYVAETLSISIDMLTKGGDLIRTFPSAHEAERWLRTNGYTKASVGAITNCCKGNRSTAYGFKWRYAQGN